MSLSNEGVHRKVHMLLHHSRHRRPLATVQLTCSKASWRAVQAVQVLRPLLLKISKRSLGCLVTWVLVGVLLA